MKRLVRHLASFALCGCCIAALPPPVAVAEGPIRQWLKERRQTPAPEAGADTETRITQPGDYRFSLQHDGLARQYRIHVPASYDPAKAVPLLFALHGGGGSMDYQADDANYGQITQSERVGHVVVFPNGFSLRPSGNFATWNAGDCCGAARDQNVDDVGFIRQVVADVTARLNIDRSRIYATGMSNGGLMAYRLACEMADVFKAIAPVAGTDNTHTCNPEKPVSVLHFHALNDTHVLFTGGAGAKLRDKELVTEFTSVADTMAKWAQLNGCSDPPKCILQRDGAWCELYAPCRGGAEVQLCVTDTGGHSWPGAGKTRGEPASQAISANELMWDFFQRQ